MSEHDNEDVGITSSFEEWKATISTNHAGPTETPEFVQRHNRFMTSPVARVNSTVLMARTMKAESLGEIEEFMKYHQEVGNEVYLYIIQRPANSSEWLLNSTGDGLDGYYFRAAVIDNQLNALKAKYQASQPISE